MNNKCTFCAAQEKGNLIRWRSKAKRFQWHVNVHDEAFSQPTLSDSLMKYSGGEQYGNEVLKSPVKFMTINKILGHSQCFANIDDFISRRRKRKRRFCFWLFWFIIIIRTHQIKWLKCQMIYVFCVLSVCVCVVPGLVWFNNRKPMCAVAICTRRNYFFHSSISCCWMLKHCPFPTKTK